MKKMQIDVMGKAPSLVEIENYNAPYLRWGRVLNKLGIGFFINSMIVLVLNLLLLGKSTPFGVMFLFLFVFLLVCAAVFVTFGALRLERVEDFISPNMCPHLKELIAKHPEVAAYREQVVIFGRKFLQSEYEACAAVEESKACKEIYTINYA